ncbi:hypothetical protein H310_10980 [Aphanomyces invadans]|uniref:Uncharacterized protein n=1 Tax=Aphanomyces invadans TaxID=157072 RepID=A0A024TN02_9STRA|nr:hypothetical protein H310_10980 [Aphanomyces invadans]ETV95535.1 hypothetical protein H310_10980 [Aphanomyces invadans]|eukprot:XP_008875728.1 hypothetical protein H310_10980 [Aphanomyces invadans]
MGNQLCGCCRSGPPLDEDLNGLLTPRKEYVPPTTCTVQRTVLKVTHPTTPRKTGLKERYPQESTSKVEEPREEEAATTLTTAARAEDVRARTPKHKHIHHRHPHAGSSVTSAEEGAHDGSNHHERHQRTRSHQDSDGGGSARSVHSSNHSLDSPSNASADDDEWTTAVSPSSKKKSKRKAKYGRANYRADSAKRNAD